jgi:hypothetical protein
MIIDRNEFSEELLTVQWYTRAYTKRRLWELHVGTLGMWLNEKTNGWWCTKVLGRPEVPMPDKKVHLNRDDLDAEIQEEIKEGTIVFTIVP